MRINSINGSVQKYKLGFKSVRTDKNEVGFLQHGVKPIGENQRINILNALNNLANEPEKANIEFLLGVADNLAYGQKGNSKFKDTLDETSIASDDRENTNWSKILENTILKAINNNKTDDLSDVQAEYTRIFAEKKELTTVQKELLTLREFFASQTMEETVFEEEEDVLRSARITKNMDYFISSSEISETQKKECLDKFIYLMSDNYKIHPQLKDKKLQVVDEMLNDMLIKTPEDDVLTIKDVDQCQSGICAAISICRKAVAYEDKSRYMEIVLSELSEEPTMEVFDITDLESGKKVTLQKPEIDYESAMAKGYRIIDTSAHIWMQHAHTSGDGTILSEAYTAFDDESYNIYDDASWYEGLDVNFSPSKKLLKALIKEQELLGAIERRRKNYKQISKTLYAEKGKLLEEQARVLSVLNSSLLSVFDGEDNRTITNLAKNIITFYKGSSSGGEVIISSKMPLELQQKIMANYIKEQMPQITAEQESKLNTKTKEIISLASDYIGFDLQISRTKDFNTNRSKYRYYRNLFQAAAAHRLAVEADVNMPDGVIRYERMSNIPPKDVRVLEYLNSLKPTFAKETVRAKYSDFKGNVPSEEELCKELSADIFAIETKIPSAINLVMQNLFDSDFSTLVSSTIKNIAQGIANGNEELLLQYADILGVKKDKTVILNSLKKYSDKLDNSPSSKDVQEAVRILGFEDTMHAASIFVSSFYQQLREGISQEEYARLVQCFGEKNVASALESTRLQFNDVCNQYQDIVEKWCVPSSRTLIIDKMEKNHSILSRKKLDKLKSKFDLIGAELVKNDKITDLKKRKKANEEACKFSQDELEIFDQIEKSLPYMKKYSKNTYKDINDYMFDALEEQYSHLGMLNGQFWVREEGSSGLSSNEQIRIIEQMTGKPYHIEYDVTDAAKQIKEGKGSGILSTSVSDLDYAFHAQYIPAVTTESFVNPSTKEKTIQDVLWTDNSWGRIEKESYWNGHDGHLYTDYGRGYGWKGGFILDDSFRIGQSVKDMHCAVGYAGKEKDKFALFSDVVLPGTPTDTYQKLYKMFNNIFEMNEGEKYINALEQAIENGAKIDIDYLVGLDDLAEGYSSKIANRIEKEIKTKEDFDKLPENDEIKIIMNQLSLYFATSNPMLRDSVLGAKTMEDVEEIKQNLVDEHIDIFSTIMAKSDTNIENLCALTNHDFIQLYSEIEKNFGIKLTDEQIANIANTIFFDEKSTGEIDGSIRGLERYLVSRSKVAAEIFDGNDKAKQFFMDRSKEIILKTIDEDIRIKTLDSPALASCPLGKYFISAVDKYLKPKSDEELLMLIQGLQETGFEMAQTFISALEPEDVGLSFKEPYDYLRKFQIDDSLVTRAFSEIVGTGFIAQELGRDDEQVEATPEDLYRTMHVKLADMDVQKYVKKFKAEAFTKYKVRQAFPQPVVFTDDEIVESVNRMLKTYAEEIASIQGNQFVLELFDKKDKFAEKYADSKLYNDLLLGKKVDTEENKVELVSLLNDFRVMYNFVSQDDSLSTLLASYGAVIELIEKSEDVIDGAKISQYLTQIDSVFSEWENSNANITTFEQNIKEEQATLRNNIRVFVKGAIEPKYRNEATEQIKKMITLMRKGASKEELQFATEELQDLCIKRHITKNPTVLLQETINCLQEGKKDSEEYSILKQYLLASLKVAQQTKVQYKLVQNQHEGIGTKTKDMLPMFNVTLADGTRQPMDSSMGMLYLIEQLRNQGDNNVTLNLFLEQSGLTENALKALIENFALDTSKTIVDETAKEIFKCIDDLSHLGNILNDYFDRSRIGYKSFKDAFEQITNYVKRKTKNRSESVIVKNFINYMEQVQVQENGIPVKSKMFKDVLASVTNSALEFLSNNVNYKIEYLESISEVLKDRADLLYEINVPQSSEAYKQREEFSVEYEKTMQYISDVVNQVYNVVTAYQDEMQPLEEG